MSKSPNKTRELTILRKHRPIEDGRRYTHDPDLRLCGKWLSETGFRSGQIVAVKCFDRKLIIEPVREPDEQPQMSRNATPVYSIQHHAVKAQLMHKFQTWGCIYAAEERLETGGTRFSIVAPSGRWYFIYLHLLDLDKSHNIKILQSELNYEVSDSKCILLALERPDRKMRKSLKGHRHFFYTSERPIKRKKSSVGKREKAKYLTARPCVALAYKMAA